LTEDSGRRTGVEPETPLYRAAVNHSVPIRYIAQTLVIVYARKLSPFRMKISPMVPTTHSTGPSTELTLASMLRPASAASSAMPPARIQKTPAAGLATIRPQTFSPSPSVKPLPDVVASAVAP